MIEVIRNWLIGVTAAAIVVALAEGVAPDGAVKKIGKLAGGLLLIVAVIQPLVGLDYEAMAGILTDYRVETEGYSAALEIENERLMKNIIEEQTGAYIQDKAAELGAECTADVTCQADDDGNFYPASVVVYGELDQKLQNTLSRTIEGDLAIPVEHQRYERTKQS